MVDDDPETDSGIPEEPTPPERPSALVLAVAAGVLLVSALGGLSGWLGYRVYAAQRTAQQSTVLVEAAKQVAVDLTSLDHHHADADVRRILDASTGEFHNDFAERAPLLAAAVQKAQSTSSGTVTEAGMESRAGDSGQVLVAVTVRTSKRGIPEPERRYWRMRLTVDRTEAGAKVSRVDFVQ